MSSQYKNTGNAHKGIYVHSENIFLAFILGYTKLTAICSIAGAVTEFVAYSALFLCVCQLWEIHWQLKSSLTPENGGFELFSDTLMFST